MQQIHVQYQVYFVFWQFVLSGRTRQCARDNMQRFLKRYRLEMFLNFFMKNVISWKWWLRLVFKSFDVLLLFLLCLSILCSSFDNNCAELKTFLLSWSEKRTLPLRRAMVRIQMSASQFDVNEKRSIWGLKTWPPGNGPVGKIRLPQMCLFRIIQK